MDERRGGFERRDDRACYPEFCKRLSSLPAVASSSVHDADSSIGFAASSVLGDAFSWGVQHEAPDTENLMLMFGHHDCLSVRVRLRVRAEQRPSLDLLPDLLAERELTGLVDQGSAQEWGAGLLVGGPVRLRLIPCARFLSIQV
jgi:hypothetical protein